MTTTTTKTTELSAQARQRPRFLGAAVLLLAAAACNGSSPATTSQVTTTSTTAPAPTTSPNAPGTTAAPQPAPAVDPEELLVAGLAAYQDGYGFDARAFINDELATRAEGRWLAGSAEFLIESGDGVVEYLITGDGQWARTPEGEWQELEGVPPLDNPLAPLATPTSLQLLAASGADVQIAGRYPAASFGLEGDPLEVTLTFRSGTLVEARYQFDVSGTEAESVTGFTPLSDTTPITAPGE